MGVQQGVIKTFEEHPAGSLRGCRCEHPVRPRQKWFPWHSNVPNVPTHFSF